MIKQTSLSSAGQCVCVLQIALVVDGNILLLFVATIALDNDYDNTQRTIRVAREQMAI